MTQHRAERPCGGPIDYPEKLAEGVFHTEECMIFDRSDHSRTVVIQQLNAGGDVIYEGYVPSDVWDRLVLALAN
ncbi:MAG: hypothetical protein CMH57_02810 [Myxococcales bacterium]|nr:hypothetical protein [Myxococcales bacterium]